MKVATDADAACINALSWNSLPDQAVVGRVGLSPCCSSTGRVQSLTRESSVTGQHYIQHRERPSKVLLFLRVAEGFCAAVENRRGGVTQPFLCLGFVDDVRHEGEQPWQFAGGCRG
jgi:hypothetical protein